MCGAVRCAVPPRAQGVQMGHACALDAVFDVASCLRLAALRLHRLSWFAHHRDHWRRIRYLDTTERFKAVPFV